MPVWGKVQELKCLDPGMGVSVNDVDGWNSELSPSLGARFSPSNRFVSVFFWNSLRIQFGRYLTHEHVGHFLPLQQQQYEIRKIATTIVRLGLTKDQIGRALCADVFAST